MPRCLQHWICKSSPSRVLWQVTKTAQAQIRENIFTAQCAVCIVLTLSKSGTLYSVKKYVKFRKFACCTGILRRTQFKSLQLEKHLNCSQPTSANNSNSVRTRLIFLWTLGIPISNKGGGPGYHFQTGWDARRPSWVSDLNSGARFERTQTLRITNHPQMTAYTDFPINNAFLIF